MREVISEIPKGYKPSPLGIIPMDWEIKELGEVSIIKGDYGINAASVEYSNILPTYLRITDIDDEGNFLSQDKKSVDDKNSEKYILNDNDIVFARTGATVGKTYLHNNVKDGQLVFAGFLIRFRVDSNKILPFYLKSFSGTKLYWDWVKKISMRSGQPGINSTEYCTLKIPLPSIAEQKLIVNGLALMDDLIGKLNQLIAKKELQKNSLMQKMLTGKKRISGFSENWKEVRLGDITANFSRRNKDLTKARIYSVTNSNGFVFQSDHFEREVAGDDLTNYKIIKKNEFAYNPARINIGSIAYFNDDVGVISSLYVCFATKDNVLDYFLEQVLKLDHTKFKIGSYGEGGVRIYLWYDLFAKIKIVLPSIEEQSAIVKVLQTADKEIQLLRAKAEKLKEQKKGMMQLLLTGKKRLKIVK